MGGATYYTVALEAAGPQRQRFHGHAREEGLQRLAAANKLKLKKSWKFAGKRYTLSPGIYRWTFGPECGRGQRTRNGDPLGHNEFCVKSKKR